MEGTILASACLNLWAMDFKENERKIIESIVQAKRMHNAKIRLGSACEVTGYSAEDHFAEPDTIYHCWQVLGSILEVTKTPPYNDILCVIGMPVSFNGSVYNSAIVLYNGEILLIRPKTVICNDLLTREKRWFTAWKAGFEVMDYILPQSIRDLYGQQATKIGNALIRTQDNYLIGFESLDEAKSLIPMSTQLFLMGAHIVCCLGKNIFTLTGNDSIDAVKTATNKGGGVYMFSNQVGFDGSRSCYEGGSLIVVNGTVLASTESFSMKDIDMAVCRVDLSEVDTYRGWFPSRNLQSAVCKSFEVIPAPNLKLNYTNFFELSKPIKLPEYSREDLVSLVCSTYLWGYLRQSGASGYFLGFPEANIESCSVIAVVRDMCERVLTTYNSVEGYNRKSLEQDLVRLVGKVPVSWQEIMREVMHTGLFFTENDENKLKAAEEMAVSLGSRFIKGSITSLVDTYLDTFNRYTNSAIEKNPGQGTPENRSILALQSRISMVLSYISGQLLPLAYQKKGFLIVLASTSLEQNLCGLHTKYGLSSGDLNPIGCIFHQDLKNYLSKSFGHLDSVKALLNVEDPLLIDKNFQLTFEEVQTLANLRKVEKYGPLSCFLECTRIWEMDHSVISQKVKLFFLTYSKNRHKATVLTPLMQFDAAGVDDNRFDLRQFLYNLSWTTQFQEIDLIVNGSV